MNKILKKIVSLTLVAALVSAMLTGCGSKKENETVTDASGNELTTVTLMLDWSANTNHTGLYVAIANGYYEEAGINLEIIETSSDGAEASVASGAVNFGISFQDTLAAAYASDEPLPVTAVAAIIQHNTSGIISLASENITCAGDMAGHSYATWDGVIEQAILKEVIEQDGASFDDVELISAYVENIELGLSEIADTVWIYYAWDGIKCELAGLETNYFDFADYGTELDYYSPVIIANDTYLSENAETVKKFLAATAKGYEYAIENPDEAAQILVDANPGLDLELCTASQEWLASKYMEDVETWGVFDADRWNAFYNWLNENDLTENEIAENTGFTNDYLS